MKKVMLESKKSGFTIEIVQGNIVDQKVDAIVNAANSSLLGGLGVDGAIHDSGGPVILEECKAIRKTLYPDGLPTGRAVITSGGNLSAPYVIHTVGPIYSQADDPSQWLSLCYESCLRLAKEKILQSLAFPAISTGAYGFPKQAASGIALTKVIHFMKREKGSLNRIVFVQFSDIDFEIYLSALETIVKECCLEFVESF